MTPKEKAKELVDKMYATQGPENGITEDEAKQCAIIAVDEILIANTFDMHDIERYLIEYKYYQEVRQEIQKL
jgi:hypothetical protein